jgi:DNA-3-methyladenine glycosylase
VWRFPYSDRDSGLLPASFFLQETKLVARELLGSYLRSTVDGMVVEGVIVETEAYVGPHDPASHAAARIGRTQRNATMFGPPGHAYVYRSYGIHWCLNVVTEEIGFPAAVLIRALDPTMGADDMRQRRGGAPTPLCAGPGRLTQALGISGELDGHPLGKDPLKLMAGWRVPKADVGISGRIGVRHASDWPLRFYVQRHPDVSRRPR